MYSMVATALEIISWGKQRGGREVWAQALCVLR